MNKNRKPFNKLYRNVLSSAKSPEEKGLGKRTVGRTEAREVTVTPEILEKIYTVKSSIVDIKFVSSPFIDGIVNQAVFVSTTLTVLMVILGYRFVDKGILDQRIDFKNLFIGAAFLIAAFYTYQPTVLFYVIFNFVHNICKF